MGLFDKLFGKKTQPVPPASDPPVSSPAKACDDIETRVFMNPLASRYRLDHQQTNVTVKTVDYPEFFQQCSGRFVTLDLETTGLDSVENAIAEIAAFRVVDGAVTDSYHQYVNPNQPMQEAARHVNHISDDMLAGQPFIYEILPDLLHFIGSDMIVAHNAVFDIRFLSQACMRYRFRIPMPWFDSMELTIAWPNLPNRQLKSFLDAAGIDNKNAHSAAGDAEALARLMIVTMKKRFHYPLPADFDFGFSNDHFTGTVDKIDNILSGKRFVITGEVENHSRYDLERLITAHGGKCSLKISNATDYLVVGSFKKLPSFYMSAKEIYAEKLISEGGKIQIISPALLFEMMGEAI